MKERPILFSAPMVRALLDGSKTQTRRIVKKVGLAAPAPQSVIGGAATYASGMVAHCPYGHPGDRIWVRETFRLTDTFDLDSPSRVGERCVDAGYKTPWAPIQYEADGRRRDWHHVGTPPHDGTEPATGKTRVSIHMPRWASRILLEIVSVRVERLNDCSEADAKAEGVMQLDADNNPRPEVRTKDGWQLCPTCGGTGLRSTLGTGGGVNFDVDCSDCDTHLKLYRHLWEAINGAGNWATNPWVWVIEFQRVMP